MSEQGRDENEICRKENDEGETGERHRLGVGSVRIRLWQTTTGQ